MLQRHAEAVQDWDRAIELDDGRDKAELQQSRARSRILERPEPEPRLAAALGLAAVVMTNRNADYAAERREESAFP